ncbi:MAG: hypothetical protein M0Z50_09320 [Planctomycetia bacterium]|nr:hypothetical protein [Planctomycetia bacterium]
MDRLTALIGEGPDRRYTMKAVVLSRYDDIVAARALMRTWRDIGDALGFDGRGKDVAGCFSRVDAAIKKGTLKVPGKAQRTVAGIAATTPAAAAVVDYGGFDKPKPKRVFDDDK